ncbi:MAG: BirA family transcriptional regulator [Aliidongia sp.]|jgi:BirA family biotin operon repressor/biotin-[acetyl-CoA-carboxylase] ligase|nr:BirA family transcriptional regulator [Aliidongia sp.]
MTWAEETAPSLPPPFSLVAYDRLGSTSDEAKMLAANGAGHGTVVWALEQTGGRGRLDRSWISPRGNLFVSAILRPDAMPAQAAELSFVAALAVTEAVESFLPDTAKVTLKWPNDVLVDNGKLAGILLEARSGPAGLVDWVVLGIGVNIAEAPAGTSYPTVCLGGLSGAIPSVGAVLARLVQALASWLECWDRRGFAPIRAAWLDRAHGLGERLEIRHGGEPVIGRFLDLDLDGALLLETPSGVRRVTAGDVHFPPA